MDDHITIYTATIVFVAAVAWYFIVRIKQKNRSEEDAKRKEHWRMHTTKIEKTHMGMTRTPRLRPLESVPRTKVQSNESPSFSTGNVYGETGTPQQATSPSFTGGGGRFSGAGAAAGWVMSEGAMSGHISHSASEHSAPAPSPSPSSCNDSSSSSDSGCTSE